MHRAKAPAEQSPLEMATQQQPYTGRIYGTAQVPGMATLVPDDDPAALPPLPPPPPIGGAGLSDDPTQLP